MSVIGEDEFAFVPDAEAAAWEGAWDGDDPAERTVALESLSATVDWAFNVPDKDADQLSILEEAVLRAASYIASQPCTCTDDESCPRCDALGRTFNKRNDR